MTKHDIRFFDALFPDVCTCHCLAVSRHQDWSDREAIPSSELRARRLHSLSLELQTGLISFLLTVFGFNHIQALVGGNFLQYLYCLILSSCLWTRPPFIRPLILNSSHSLVEEAWYTVPRA